MKTGATCHTLEGVVRFPVPQPEGWGIGKGPSGESASTAMSGGRVKPYPLIRYPIR